MKPTVKNDKFLFIENTNLLASRQDHIFVPVGETTEISLDAYQFNTLVNCSNDENYSVTKVSMSCKKKFPLV